MVRKLISITPIMIERLLVVFGKLGLTLGDVAKKSGVQYDTLFQIKAGRVKSMRCDTLASIIEAYPSINANYVLTGAGESLLSTTTTDDLPVQYIPKTGAIIRVEE